jgi:hypothetical protein
MTSSRMHSIYLNPCFELTNAEKTHRSHCRAFEASYTRCLALPVADDALFHQRPVSH